MDKVVHVMPRELFFCEFGRSAATARRCCLRGTQPRLFFLIHARARKHASTQPHARARVRARACLQRRPSRARARAPLVTPATAAARDRLLKLKSRKSDEELQNLTRLCAHAALRQWMPCFHGVATRPQGGGEALYLVMDNMCPPYPPPLPPTPRAHTRTRSALPLPCRPLQPAQRQRPVPQACAAIAPGPSLVPELASPAPPASRCTLACDRSAGMRQPVGMDLKIGTAC